MNTKRIGAALILAGLLLLTVSALLYTETLTIWEDGSWALGSYPYPVTGCPAGAYCSTSPGFAFCATWIDSLHNDASWHFTENRIPVADCNGWVEFGE